MYDIIFLRKLIAVIIVCVIGLAPAIALAKPPQPVAPPPDCYCAECGMYVKGEGLKFVSEIIFKDGKRAFFCDLGDLFLYYEVLKNKKGVTAVYVKDYPTGAWVDARAALYLAGTGMATPMRYGILAFKDRAGAERFKKEKGGGGIYTFDGLAASRLYRR